jgi:N-acetylmuramoyl-L-alanine amidase
MKDELVQFVKKVNPAFKEEIAAAFLAVGAKYGVRGDIAFVQSIHETNWFRFGGDVKAEQNNFAGLGATGGVAGNSFPTITAGVTAQIQHLYAYATNNPLPTGESLIDTRFSLVTRGSAKNWEELAGTWAVPGYDKTKYGSLAAAMQAGDSYGQNIVKLFAAIPAAAAPPAATGPIVVLDAGHGGTDSGAQGFGIVEKDKALSIALKVRDRLLSQYVVQVKMTRDTDVFIPLQTRAEMANNWNADYFVALHHNASGGRGFESYVYTGTRTKESGKKQDVVHAAIIAYLSTVGVNDRGKQEANFAVIRETKMPAILIENLFVDNAFDAALLNNAAVVDKLCDAIALGIGQALQLAAVPAAPTPEEPEDPTTPVPDVTADYPPGMPQWRIDAVEWLYIQGLLTDKSWKMKLNDPLPLWAEATILKRLYEKLSDK